MAYPFLTCLLAVIVGTAAAQAPPPPNVIYILVDDLGYGDVNLGLAGLDRFGNPHVRTPHLAALARRGLVLTQHYAASPVCSPSRAGLLTGRTPTRANIGLYINDVRDNEKYFLRGEELTVAEVLRERGYQTAIFGKWHLNGADWEKPANWDGWTGSFPRQQGFDHGMVSKENPHFTRRLRVNTQKHPGDFFTVDGRPLGALKGYTSDIITDTALAWILEERDPDRPFFAYLPYDAVHIRVAAADRYEQMYDTGNARQDAYYANITHLDAAIGRLVDSLTAAGIMDNTLLLFSSDNGPDVLNMWDATYFCYGTSYPLRGQKYQLYEGGIRVPGLVVWPGVVAPGISDEPNSTLDLLPTLAELTGARLPDSLVLDGSSMLGFLRDGQPIERARPLYWQFDLPREYVRYAGQGYQRRIEGPDRSDRKLLPRVKLRTRDRALYGLSEEAYAPPTAFELYDVINDPEEERELSEAEPELFAQLRLEMLDRHAAVEHDRLTTENWAARTRVQANAVNIDVDTVTYARHDSTELTLIIAYPRECKEPLPAIIHFHGGGWRKGSASRKTAEHFARNGFVGISLHYRLSQQAIFPAAVHDGKAAVRWARTRGRDYGIDPDRIGLLGGSAGGYLALMVGLSAGDDSLPRPVQAIVENYGPTDFAKMNDFPGNMDHDSPTSPESRFLGGPVQEVPERVRRANPVTYVDADDPPTLIFHGKNDMSVPFNQSEIIHDALRRAGVTTRLVPVEGAGHGFKPSGQGVKIAPSRREIGEMTLGWFRRYL